MPDGIHHIGVIVRDIDTALNFYGAGLGLEVSERREVPEEGVEIAMLPTGAGTIELITPLDDASSIARSLKKRGEGVHHVCVSVGDIDAAMKQLRAAGARLLSKDPIVGAHGIRRVFVHPRSAHGVLIEVYEE